MARPRKQISILADDLDLGYLGTPSRYLILPASAAVFGRANNRMAGAGKRHLEPQAGV